MVEETRYRRTTESDRMDRGYSDRSKKRLALLMAQ